MKTYQKLKIKALLIMLKINVKNFHGKINKNNQLKKLISNNKISTADRGWIKQELNMIYNKWCNSRGKLKKNIRKHCKNYQNVKKL